MLARKPNGHWQKRPTYVFVLSVADDRVDLVNKVSKSPNMEVIDVEELLESASKKHSRLVQMTKETRLDLL